AATLSSEFWDRASRLTTQRQHEQAQMQAYVNLSHGHMQFLVQAFDGDVNAVTPPPAAPLPGNVDTSLLSDAWIFQNRGMSVAPRKQWPTGGLPKYALSGKIPTNL